MSSLLIDLIPMAEYNSQIRLYADQSYSGGNPLEVLRNTKEAMYEFMAALPSEKVTFKYGVGKWTVGEVIQHVITYEQIFIDRIQLAIDKNTELKVPYYTQSSTAASAKEKSKTDLLNDFTETRDILIQVISSLTEDELKLIGSIDGFKASVRALVACASGHQRHHFGVLKERYLK